jgi:hypothetical protein
MNPAAPLLEDEGAFPVSRCARCARDVLTHVHVELGEPRRLCLHCDAEIDPAEVRWVDETTLASIGYGLEDEEAGGCGRPGCGRGNCSNRR